MSRKFDIKPKQALKPEPTLIVIFGITGDLSRRYLLPSLYHVIKDGLMHEQSEIIGVTRGTTTTKELFEDVELCVNEINNVCDPAALNAMHERTSMFQMDLEDSADYDSLLKKLNDWEEEKGICMNRLYYLSIPPQAYLPVIRSLGERGLNTSCQHNRAVTRLLVEKPFGFDTGSAQELISQTAKFFSEEQVFRIDHYMAKQTIQNILNFRFQNPVFEELWNQKNITCIEISAKEKIGIEGRAAFYEPLGALRDFIQSHLLQILAIVTMDKPKILNSEHIHANKQALLKDIEPVPAAKVSERAARGQYEGYREEVNNPDSATETFAAITVFINNSRWQGVPIRLLTGKALDERKSEICVTFRSEPDEASSQLRFRIQPDKGIQLDLKSKKPSYTQELEYAARDFSYQNDSEDQGHPNAYERVLVNAIRGDRALFATSQEVLDSWRIVQPVLDAWSVQSDDLKLYKPGVSDPLRET